MCVFNINFGLQEGEIKCLDYRGGLALGLWAVFEKEECIRQWANITGCLKTHTLTHTHRVPHRSQGLH